MKFYNALNTIEGVGCKKLKLLANYFGSGEKIWKASEAELRASGVGESLSRKIASQRSGIDPDFEWQKLEQENIIAVSMEDERYPFLLKQVIDCPYILYLKGDLACLDMPLVAIVGSRKLTSYGSQAARIFSRDLAKNGICVVSGLAFGIDACAHNGALEVKGKTIAVLGNSLDDESIAPRSNLYLARDIINSGGLLVSEFPVQTKAQPGTFPARNRVMAGMSSGTLVIEAALKSGSLITANMALDYNREVFAIPGLIFSPQSEGTNLLIKSGAKLTCSVQDILEELKISKPNKANASEKKPLNIELNKDEDEIITILTHESIHIDRITKLTKLDTSTVSSTLAILEIKGLIKNVGGQNYIRL